MCPDLTFIDISTAWGDSIKLLKLFDLTNLIDKNYFNKEPKEIFCWGFPSNDKKHKVKLVKGDNLSIYNTEDNRNEFKLYKFLKNFGVEPGMSGAPMYGVYFEKGKKVIKLFGIVVMGNQEKNSLVLIKAWTIQKFIDQF